MILNSVPKAYNIDNILEFLSHENSIFMFYFVGIMSKQIVGLAVSKAKIKVMHAHAPQIIRGLLVNKGVALTRQKQKEIFSDVANGRMAETSLEGWLANLNMIDKRLMRKLQAYAIQKGIIRADA